MLSNIMIVNARLLLKPLIDISLTCLYLSNLNKKSEGHLLRFLLKKIFDTSHPIDIEPSSSRGDSAVRLKKKKNTLSHTRI